MKRFGSRLEELRGENTQKQFAELLDIPLNTYTNWVRGVREPSATAIVNLCTQLDVSADWLLGLSGSRDRREAPSRAARADPTVARFSSCAPSASPALTLRRAARPSEPTLSDVMAELQSLKRRVIALESSTSMATCG